MNVKKLILTLLLLPTVAFTATAQDATILVWLTPPMYG